MARVSGTVNARVVVSSDGSIKTAAYSGNALLVGVIQHAMDRSQLPARCAGEYNFNYRFVPASKLHEHSIRFKPPNQLLLTAPPVTCDHCYAEPGRDPCSFWPLMTPHYPRLALIARVHGVVEVRAVIGPDGTLRTAAYTGHPLLVQPVKDLLARSRLPAGCGASQFRLTYRFEIRGQPTFSRCGVGDVFATR